MNWQAPWVWLGAATIIVPVLIHLLGQGKARHQLFPTLKFFGEMRPLPTRRTRLHDQLLLVIRAMIFLLAVAALAKPLLRTATRERDFNATIARAIIVDTSASMNRPGSASESARTLAERTAKQIADTTPDAIIVHTAIPAGAISGATMWLEQQSGRHELVIISDMQTGTIDSAAIAEVGSGIGVRLVKVAATGANIGAQWSGHDGVVAANATLIGDRTEATWSVAQTTVRRAPDIEILGGSGDSANIGAIRQAAATIPMPLSTDSTHHVAIVYPGASARAALLQQAHALDAGWMADVAQRIAHDPLLVEAASRTHGAIADRDARLTPLVLDGSGIIPLVLAAVDATGANARLLLLSTEPDAGSYFSAALLVAVERATASDTPLSEQEPGTLSDALVAKWQRSATPSTAPGPANDESDGRYFWMAALVLLGIEALVRRGTNTTTRLTDNAAI